MKISKPNIVCIIQARMKSSRMPNKVLLDLAGAPVVYHVLNQLSFCKKINNIVLATSTEKEDDIIEIWAKNNKISCIRGSLNNVLERYYLASVKYEAEIVVRVTSDCPLINPILIDEAIEYFLNNKVDYVCNNNPPTYPEGLDLEVFSFKALEKAYLNATRLSEKEHVTPYIINNPNIFLQHNIKNSQDLSNYRLTLDHYDDYLLLYQLFLELYKTNCFIDLPPLIEYLKMNTKLVNLNKHIERNEGYLKSLEEDKKIGKRIH